MIIKVDQFIYNDFLIPRFSLTPNHMVRLWVQVIPQVINDKEVYFEMKNFQKNLTGSKENVNIAVYEKLKITPYKTYKNWWKIFKSQTVYEYLQQNFKLDDNSITEKLNYFNLKPEYEISKLGFGHQRLFSIICEFQKSKNVIFDYYGLSPQSETDLTNYVLSELKNGKSAISFDNMQYKNGSVDSDEILNVNIYRKDQDGLEFNNERPVFELK